MQRINYKTSDIKFTRVWDKNMRIMSPLANLDCVNSVVCHYGVAQPVYNVPFKEVIIMPQSGVNDKNGNKIFLFDIIKLNDEWADLIDAKRKFCLVGLQQGTFLFGKDSDPFHLNSYLWMTGKYCEIAGNYFQNKDLLVELR